MLNQEAEERLAEVLVKRIDDINEEILETIGNKIQAVSLLSPTEARQLAQILKYGGDYRAIAKKLAEVSGKNIQEIYKIFEKVAKSNKEFAKQFYKYRNVEYIPYNQDRALKEQVNSIARVTAGLYQNIANTSAIGYVINGRFVQLERIYSEVIDQAILSILQGKDTYYNSMRKIIKDIGGNGLVQYESGRVRRLDSAIRMNILDGIRQVSNETNQRFGEEYGADGIEISVHSHPAPDHADIQGRQFSKEEFEKLENEQVAKDVRGRSYNGAEKRRISEYNCYHKTFNIVLGISKPAYSDEQLERIQKENEKGFEFGGKHYSMYEGTQLQRRLELEIKKHKEQAILLRASGDKKGLAQEQIKIRRLNEKYNELNRTSGLSNRRERMSVSGYKRTPKKVQEIKIKYTN